MAIVYCDASCRRIPPRARVGLPLKAIRDKLRDPKKQKLIPFLGAGASLVSRTDPSLPEPSRRTTPQEMDDLCTQLGITQHRSKRFLEIAIQFAQLLDHRSAIEEEDEAAYAPSSWHLARRLARTLRLEPLRPSAEMLRTLLRETPERDDYLEVVRAVADLMGLSRAVPQLLTVASYFNRMDDRTELRRDLAERFRQVTQVTAIQEQVALAAKTFVETRNGNPSADKTDYLIITTNYDQLMERHLAEREVPTCVVTVDRKSRVQPLFMDGTQDILRLTNEQFSDLHRVYEGDDPDPRLRLPASKFALENKSHSMAMVYKIHGCPILDQQFNLNNIVISDQDYVLFIQKNGANNELIPSYVGDRILKSGLLFLGYSFSDWNVRSLYQQFVKGRQQAHQYENDDDSSDEDRDYIVMRSYDDTDEYFLQKWDVSVLVAELDDFASGISAERTDATTN
jgi:hypothetical protein